MFAGLRRTNTAASSTTRGATAAARRRRAARAHLLPVRQNSRVACRKRIVHALPLAVAVKLGPCAQQSLSTAHPDRDRDSPEDLRRRTFPRLRADRNAIVLANRGVKDCLIRDSPPKLKTGLYDLFFRLKAGPPYGRKLEKRRNSCKEALLGLRALWRVRLAAGWSRMA